MARYGIIDLDKLSSWEKYFEETGDMISLGVIKTLKFEKTFLSPEETEAKWKECFEAGVKSGVDISHCFQSGDEFDEKLRFETFKQSL